MDKNGDVIQLNLPAPGPGATWVMVSDYVNKTVSLILINTAAAPNFRIQVWEVQSYTVPGN
jgi:hypothetical protein